MRRRASFPGCLVVAFGVLTGFASASLAQGGVTALIMPIGAELTYEDHRELGSYAVPTAGFKAGIVPAEVLEGAVLRQSWRVPGDIGSTLALLSPLRQQIVDAGYDTLLDCKTQACGGFDFRFATEVLPGPGMYVDLTDFRFLSARGPENTAISVLVSRSAAAGFVQVIHVGTVGAVGAGRIETDKKGPSASVPPRATGSFAQQLDTSGRVVLADLTFDSGAATLGAGDFASLQDIAAYLRAHPTRRIALVGHTDSIGGLDGNIALSRRRAQSVLSRLTGEYDVSASQLEAGGMGYLAPLTSNLTLQGREANRRVEAVLVSTE